MDLTAIDPHRLGTWLDGVLSGPSAPVSVADGEQAGIRARRVERAGASYALRLPEAGFDREVILLKGLARSPIQHPRLVAVCADDRVIGAPFVLTQWIEGFTPDAVLPDSYSDEPSGHSLAEELIDGLVAITIANWPAMGLSALGDPENFLQRQVDHWVGRSADAAGLDALRDWLTASVPPMQRKALVHGAYGFANTIFSAVQPPRMAAIVGWDAATIGDPMLDLAEILAGWPNPDEPPSHVAGVDWSLFPPRSELLKRYAQRTALAITNVKFYFAFALFKQAVRAGGVDDALLARANHFAGIGA